MLTEKFFEVIQHEGVVSITTWGGSDAPSVTNTWNSYLVVTEDGRILIPAAGMTTTQKDVEVNNAIILTLGTREVVGTIGPGAGFRINGTAKFVKEGAEFDMMKEKYSFIREVLEVTPVTVKQTI